MEDNEKRIIKKAGSVVLGMLLMSILLGSFFVVGAGERGVIFNKFSGIKQINYGEGFHFKIPLIEGSYKFEVRTKIYESEAEAASKDLQIVKTKVALNYHLDPNSISTLFKNIGEDYQTRIIIPSIQEIVKSTTAEFEAEKLITNREIVKEQIKSRLKIRLSNSFIILDDLSITNFDFSPEFNKAIEDKVVNQQRVLTASNILERLKIEAEQKVVSAKAEAEALNVQKQVVTKELIELRKVENQKLFLDKWDGHLPQFLGNGDISSVIDIGGLSK